MSDESEKIETEDELNRFIELHHFKNIDEVVKTPIEELIKMDGFGMRMFVAVQKLKKEIKP